MRSLQRFLSRLHNNYPEVVNGPALRSREHRDQRQGDHKLTPGSIYALRTVHPRRRVAPPTSGVLSTPERTEGEGLTPRHNSQHYDQTIKNHKDTQTGGTICLWRPSIKPNHQRGTAVPVFCSNGPPVPLLRFYARRCTWISD